MLAFGDYMAVSCHACIGGKNLGEDMRVLGTGVQVVSGTPGRVYDMIKRRALKTQKLKMLVIDEAVRDTNQHGGAAALLVVLT
jgi:ATP-dependent RNA helicase